MQKWVKQWLSEPRLRTYLRAAGEDEQLALALYLWNTHLAGALLRDLSDVEVLVRNKFNAAIVNRRGGPHWLLDPASPVRVEKLHTRRGEVVDANLGIRSKIERAIKDAGEPSATPGHVVAQLTFGFWLTLVRRGREHEIWTPYVAHAFKPRQRRDLVERRMAKLSDLRNRVAHHEHLLSYDIPAIHSALVEFAGWLSPNVAEHIRQHSTVATVLGERPH